MDDRNAQNQWLQEQSEIASHADQSNGDVTANELQKFWEDQSTSLPEWFDNHDRLLMVEYIDSHIG